MTSNEKTKAQLNSSASFLLYLLNLFEGKISISEMKQMDYSLLIALKEVKEQSVIDENKRLEYEKRKMNN